MINQNSITITVLFDNNISFRLQNKHLDKLTIYLKSNGVNSPTYALFRTDSLTGTMFLVPTDASR